MNNASNVWNNTELHSSLRTLKIPLWQDKPRRGGSRKSVQYLSSYMAWFGCSRVFTISTTNIYLQWTLLTLEFVIWCIQHEFHETCHSVTFHFMKKDSKWWCDTTTPESIHTKDESKRGSAFAFIFGVNWPVQWM